MPTVSKEWIAGALSTKPPTGLSSNSHAPSKDAGSALKKTELIFKFLTARFICSSMLVTICVQIIKLDYTVPVKRVRLTILRPKVISSAYSSSSPTEMPRAITLSLTPIFSSLR